jgi:hypothetical protein
MNRSKTPKLPPQTLVEESYIRGIVERSEAGLPDKDGKLPEDLTHEIIGQRPDGLPVLREKRKKLW